MFWLNSMDASYKITLCNEYQSVEKFLESIRNERNETEYPDIAKGIRQWQESKLADANSTVRTLRYLTITCRADSLDQANIYFRALEPMIEDAFAGWGSDIAVLGTWIGSGYSMGCYVPEKSSRKQYCGTLCRTGKVTCCHGVSSNSMIT